MLFARDVSLREPRSLSPGPAMSAIIAAQLPPSDRITAIELFPVLGCRPVFLLCGVVVSKVSHRPAFDPRRVRFA